MRLIDADSIQIPHFTLATDRIKMIDAIDEAPTIEPQTDCPYYPCAVWDEMAFTRERREP